jgi:hypothetical protein
MRRASAPATALVVGALSVLGCDRSPVAPDWVPAADTGPAPAVRAEIGPEACALRRTDFTLASPNDFFPIGAGSWWVYTGTEDGEVLVLRIAVLDETEVVGGVTTRVIEESEWEGGELLEVSRNYVAATGEGTVCYFGEAVDIYEDGEVVSHEGAWRADAPGNAPGVLMPADPRPFVSFQMERAPGIAEDRGMVVATGRYRVPIGLFSGVIAVRETNPLDGGVGYKYYAPGVGLLVDGAVRLAVYRVTNH